MGETANIDQVNLFILKPKYKKKTYLISADGDFGYCLYHLKDDFLYTGMLLWIGIIHLQLTPTDSATLQSDRGSGPEVAVVEGV